MSEHQIDYERSSPFLDPRGALGEIPPLPHTLRHIDVAPNDTEMHRRIFFEVDLPEQQHNTLLGTAAEDEFLEMCERAALIGAVEDGDTTQLKGYIVVSSQPSFGYILQAGVTHSDRVLEVDSIVVSDDYKGQGVGSWLLDQADAFARTNGYTDIYLRTHADNPARWLYRKHGYDIDPLAQARSEYSGRWHFTKFTGTQQDKIDAYLKTKSEKSKKQINRALTSLSAHLPGSNILRSTEECKVMLSGHIEQFLQTHNVTATTLSQAQKKELFTMIRTHDLDTLRSPDSEFSRTEYIAELLHMSPREVISYYAFFHLMRLSGPRYQELQPPSEVGGDATEQRAPATINSRVQQTIEESLVGGGTVYNRAVCFSEDLSLVLRRLAKTHSGQYINQQLALTVQQLEQSTQALPSISDERRLLDHERILAVFDQLVLFPSCLAGFLDNPIVKNSSTVAQQAVLESAALRIWNRFGDSETVAEVLRFAQDTAEDSQAVARHFVTTLFSCLHPGREEQAVKLFDMLPNVLPETDMQALYEQLQNHQLWQVALEVGRGSSVR